MWLGLRVYVHSINICKFILKRVERLNSLLTVVHSRLSSHTLKLSVSCPVSLRAVKFTCKDNTEEIFFKFYARARALVASFVVPSLIIHIFT